MHPPDPKNIIEIYVDESSQTKHRFLVLGAVVVPLSGIRKLNELIVKARQPELPEKEAKWVRVSSKKLVAYKRIVNVLLENRDHFQFHSLYVTAFMLNHQKYNAGSREIGFNKEIYQLSMKVARLYPDRLFHLYPDHRETTQKPEDLRLILNRGCRKRGDNRDWPFRRCQFRDSKTTLSLQLTDILIGAIAYRLNGHAEAENAAPAKKELSDYILKRAGIADVFKGTMPAAKFSIWPRKLR